MTDPRAQAREIVEAWQTRHTTRVRVLGELDKDELIDDIAAALTPAAPVGREEIAKALSGAMKAASELMTEFISKKRAANWGVINDGLCEAGRVLALLARQEERSCD